MPQSPAAETYVTVQTFVTETSLILNDLRYGPIFVGVMFNIVLYGIMITQTFLYFTMYKR